ncbi:MAG: hypothetical protein N2Z21_01355 [Candidatus Sumerlaeaceae bacterium]|nr:hypothetical protein [Candidatus Sumerlaeaceae bacterium]
MIGKLLIQFVIGIFIITQVDSARGNDADTCEVSVSPLTCDQPTTTIETKDRKSGRKWLTPIIAFCPEEYLLATSASLPLMNRKVVERLLRYPRDGRHDYFWPRKGEVIYDGGTTDVIFNGALVMKGESKGRTYCCGLTLEVFYRVLQEIEKVPPQFLALGPQRLKLLWFCPDLYSPGPSEALEALQVGRGISPDAALAGDFVQIWRHNKSGHSVIFIAWAYSPEGKRVGIHYWSTQEATKGIGFAVEAIGDAPPMIWLEKTSFARLLSPDDWR